MGAFQGMMLSLFALHVSRKISYLDEKNEEVK